MTTTGQQLGNYILGEPLSRSGLALVHRGEHAATGRPVILKIIHRYFATESAVIQQFFAELPAVKDLHHPNIVALEDFGLDGATAWLALELIDGTTLKEAPLPPYPPALALEIASHVADALEFAHARGILHRNLKPNNVFVTPNGTVKLADFAMATLGAGVHPLMRTALTTPLPTFMSPEHAEGKPLTPQSDTYALGILVYWMLTGETPFSGDTPETVLALQLNSAPVAPSRLRPSLTREIDAVVLKALAPFLRARYGTPSEFIAALREAIGVTEPYPLAGVFAPGTRFYPVEDTLESAAASAAAAAESQRIEDAFRRIWAPAKSNRRRVIISLTLTGLVTAGVAGWAWWSVLAPLPYLPLPATDLTVQAVPGTWPSFRRDIQRTAAETGIDPKFVGQVRWTFRNAAPLLASPAVAHGLVYQPTSDRRLVALDAATGALRWEAPTTGPVDSTPAIAGDSLYVGLRDGRLLCLDAHTGELRWEYNVQNPIFSSPTVAGGTVLFGAGDSRIHAVDAATGEPRWSFQAAGWFTGSPTVWENLVVIGSRDGWVYVLDINNGARQFYFHTGGGVEASPAVAEGHAYIGNERGRFWALRTSERSTPLDRQIYAIHAQLFLWGMSPPPPPLKGVVWSKRGGSRFTGSAAVSGTGVYVGNEDGTMYAWDPDGADLWKFKAGGPIQSSPALVGSTLYFGADDGKVYAVDTRTGQQQWTFATADKVRTAPAVTADGVYVAGSDGVLYALR